MDNISHTSTSDIIRQARETCRRTAQIVTELDHVRREAQETVNYSRWWRYVGFDPHARVFLDRLEMKK